MKIIRAAIYLGVIAFLLPSPPEQPAPRHAALGMAGAAPAPVASNGDLLAAALGAVDDMSGFCTRQPAVCDTARILLVKLEAKAKYSMRLLYQWAETPEHAGGAQHRGEARRPDHHQHRRRQPAPGERCPAAGRSQAEMAGPEAVGRRLTECLPEVAQVSI